MAYLDCPKCGMKFHEKAVECPMCKITPEAYRNKLAKSEAAALKYKDERAKVAAVRERERLTYCTACGSTFERAKWVTGGSFFIELFLWLLLLVPGLIYSIWRLTTKFKACPICQAKEIIPANSPKAEQAIGKV